MDDRNLVAIAEQAAATSLVKRNPIAGVTLLAEDGRHYMGCALEFEQAADDLCPLSNALAAARVEGSRRVVRAGYYSPRQGELPVFSAATLRRLQESARDDFAIVLSPGGGLRVTKSLAELWEDVNASS